MGPEARKELWHRKKDSRWKIRDRTARRGRVHAETGVEPLWLCKSWQGCRAAKAANSWCRVLGTKLEIIVEVGNEVNSDLQTAELQKKRTQHLTWQGTQETSCKMSLL